MIEIIPAVIPKSLKDLEEKLMMIRGLVRCVQIDVIDGKFAPSPSWPYRDENDQSFKEMVSEKSGLPFWQDFDFEADLMIKNPEEVIADFAKAGFSRVIIHIESSGDVGDAISVAQKSGVSPVLAANIETAEEEIEKWLKEADGVQLMGIARIGFQGEPFDEMVISKIKNLRERHPDLIISVDGGVNIENAPKLISAGANRLAVGSAIFKSEDIAKTIKDFQKLN